MYSRQRSSIPLVLAALSLFAATVEAQESGTTELFLDGSAGDYIGQGEISSWTPAEGAFTVSRNYDDGVSVDFAGAESWSVDFAAPGNEDLAPGDYDGATRWPFQDASAPGLSVSGDGRSCNTLTGRFVVHEVEYATDGTVERFAADFVQYCGSSPLPLVGAVRIGASPELATPVDQDVDGMADIADNCPEIRNPHQLDSDGDGSGDRCDSSLEATFLLLDSEPGDWVGQGERRIFTALDSFFIAGRNNHDGVGIDIEPVGGLSWNLDFVAPERVPLQPGVYEGALRWPFQAIDEPGLAVSGEGRGCNQVTGRFEVFEAVYGPDGAPERFSADFEQHCEGEEPGLFGSVRFRAAFRPGPADQDGDGWLDDEDNCPAAPNPAQGDWNGDGVGNACTPLACGLLGIEVFAVLPLVRLVGRRRRSL